MYPRTNYEMTDEALEDILDACKPTPAILVGRISPSTPQENANRAWKALGEEMGFDHMTVKPISGKGDRFFSAVPSENEKQREDRLKREKYEKRNLKIKEIEEKILALNDELKQLKGG